ncbi:MAG: Uma2 family endonuclease [Crocosphaera sp.]|nr:Uma2 family endonuclease [Crocosphaera sp.]
MKSITTDQVCWTISDLEGLPDNSNRYEIINGQLFVTRAPHLDHQDIAGNIYAELRNWSRKKQLGKAFMTPGIIFSDEKDIKRDRQTKLKLYSIHGVCEYWIIDRQQQLIEVYLREQGILKKGMTLYNADQLTSPLLLDFSCKIKEIFEN